MTINTRRETIIVTGGLNTLGAFHYSNKIYLLFRTPRDEASQFSIAQSDNGFDFELLADKGAFTDKEIPIDLNKIKNLKFSLINHDLVATGQIDKMIFVAKFKSLKEWKIIQSDSKLPSTGLVIKNNQDESKYFFIGEKKQIKISHSTDLISWSKSTKNLIESRDSMFDSGDLETHALLDLPEGKLLLYQSKYKKRIKIGGLIIDKNNPEKIIWRSKDSIWESLPEWDNLRLSFIGAVEHNEKIISYWHVNGIGIYAVVYLHKNHHINVQSRNISLFLDKHFDNPIIAPSQENAWEAFTTFNPAAIYENNKVHILYRAQGHDYSSVIGYASSTDGVTIDERSSFPCYIPKEDFESTGIPSSVTKEYVSGGGFGGCEDPRITKIDGRIYMTYVAFNGSSEPRIAITSIAVDDFLNHRWFWERPVLISPPGIIDKSPCIFPEKINDKYVIMHRVFPNILIDYVDSLEFDGTTWLKGEKQIKIRTNQWDSRKIGAGAPPIKTKDGWLLIYYAVDERDDRRYKIGAMVLDSKDPSKVLYRTNNPILEPNERYENEGFKAGVAYPCGAVVVGPTLFVYYGAADTYVCVATANLDHFLSELKYANFAKLEPAYIRPISK